MVQPYMMGRRDLWPALGSEQYGLGAGFGMYRPFYGAGPRSGGGFDVAPGLGPLLMRPGMPIPPVPPGTSPQTADAVRFRLAALDAIASLTDPLTPKERQQVEEALAREDARQLWARVFGPEPGAREATPTIGTGDLDVFGAYGGALGLRGGPLPPSSPGTMQAQGTAPSGDDADITEAAIRTYMKLIEAPHPPVADHPSITEAAAMVRAGAPGMPDMVPPRYDAVGGEFAATAPRWRVDAAASYDALNAQRETILANLAQGYARTADAAFGGAGEGGSDRLPMSAPFGTMQSHLDPSLDADGRSLVQPMHDASRKDVQSFAIPNGTVYTIRKDDAGDGHYGASRDGRKHKGVDLVAAAGEGVLSLIDGHCCPVN